MPAAPLAPSTSRTNRRHFKLVMVQQKYMFDPALPLGFLPIINLMVDPKELEPVEPRYMHTWTLAHFTRILSEFQASLAREPLIPAGSPLDFIPGAT